MAQKRIIVRPRRQAPPRVQHWLVTRGGSTFTLRCVEGHFFTEYRRLGYDPYVDLDAGRLERVLISTVR